MTTGPITVIPAPATHLVVITQPPSLVTPGTTFGFVVAAEDDFGNVATGYTGTISVARTQRIGCGPGRDNDGHTDRAARPRSAG